MRKFMTTFVLGITLICGTQSSYAHVAAAPDQDSPPTAEEWDEGADASHSAPVGETNYGIGRYPKNVAFLEPSTTQESRYSSISTAVRSTSARPSRVP